jgi:AcrR family transcriptional regulator
MTTQQAAPGRSQNTGSGRVQRKRGQRIEEIVRTAAELFGERGYDAVNLEDVAERLDVTKGSLYYYFASKEELGTAAIETLGNEWTARLEKVTETHDGPPAALLGDLLREHITTAVRDYPEALRLFLVPRAWPAEQAERIKELRRRHDLVFRSVIENGVATGDFTVIDLDTTLQCLHASMTQAPLWCTPLRGRARQRAVENLANTLMMLVGCRPED